jgi:hypothetical protein
MKAVALLVVLAGYAALVYGVDHVTGGCVSLRDVVWPRTSAITNPCKGGSSTTTAGKTPTTVTSSLSPGKNPTGLTSGTTPNPNNVRASLGHGG